MRLHRSTSVCGWTLFVTATAQLALASHAANNTSASIAGSAGPNVDWPYYGNTLDEQRFSSLTQVSTQNIQRLGLAWSLDVDGENGLEASPVSVGGTIYFSGSMARVYAVDVATGKLKWRYSPEYGDAYPKEARIMYAVNRGVAYWEGKVFVSTKDGRLIAIDAETGKPVWEVNSAAPGSHQMSTGAPRVFNGKVLIGNSGSESKARGCLAAFDASTGKLIWRFYLVPGKSDQGSDPAALKMAAKTWKDQWWWTGGAVPWSGISFDPALNQVYVGTANGLPYSHRSRRAGRPPDNLFIDSIVALDADTGKYRWHYQTTPGDVWEFDAISDLMLADIEIKGTRQQVLMQANKNGFFYVLDRKSGKLLSADKFAKVTWASRIDMKTGRPVEIPGSRYEKKPFVTYPSIAGANSWQSTSYNPNTGLVYIPYMEAGNELMNSDDEHGFISKPVKQGFTTLGYAMIPLFDEKAPLDTRGSLIAWDAKNQRIRWRVDHPSMSNGGTMTTAGGLVFQGNESGDFVAYDAANGTKLWSFHAGLGIIAAPITYSVAGTQYISVLVGYGGTAGEGGPWYRRSAWYFGEQPRRLLTFALGGSATLPVTRPRGKAADVQVLDDPSLKLEDAKIEHGAKLYNHSCTSCHGWSASATGGGPDLRGSAVAANRDALKMFLHTGPRVAYGMPRFDDFTDEDVEGIFQYIRSNARQSLQTPDAKH